MSRCVTLPRNMICLALCWTVLAQSPQAPKAAAPGAQPPAAVKSTSKKAAVTANPVVDEVIDLVKGGMSEAMVIRTLRISGKSIKLTPAEMLKLQKAGVSEAIMSAMLESGATPTSAPTAVATPVAAATSVIAGETPLPPQSGSAKKAPRKRRLAVMPFKSAAVEHWVHYWFHSPNYNVGQGIRAMLGARMAQAKSVTLVEREELAAIEKELKMGQSNLTNQGTRVKMGKINSADCILLGDITIFGRDDKAESSRSSGVMNNVGGFLGNRLGTKVGSMGTFKKEEKAVVAIALRIVDTETGEVLETAEARGESKRESKKWDVFASSNNGSIRSEGNEMMSSNFQATIIGEATSDAVDKVVAFLEDRVPGLPLRSRGVEGAVAKISNNSPILAIGANDGIEVGDRFEIFRIVSEVFDPNTKERIDVELQKAGEFVAETVRDKTASGVYGGKALDPNHKMGYLAKLIVTP